MKKIILSIALIAFIFSINAQINIKPMDKALPKEPKSKEKVLFPEDKRLLQKDYEGLGWIHTAAFLNNLIADGQTLTRRNVVLLPDTCLKVHTTKEKFFPGLIGMGFVLDPCSPVFDSDFSTGILPTPPEFTHNYRLDSLEIWGLYYLGNKGYNTASPDTLRVYVTSVAPYRGQKDHYATLMMNGHADTTYLVPKIAVNGANKVKGATITPTSPNTQVIDYILQPNDTVRTWDSAGESWFRYSIITIPLTYDGITANGFEVPYGDALGVMVHFIPGYEYNLDDTLYWGMLDEFDPNKWAEGYPIRINNQFSMLYNIIEGTYNPFADPIGFNTPIATYDAHRYQMFTGQAAFLNEYYFPTPNLLPYMFFRISEDKENGGIIVPPDNVIETNDIVSNIYPNPAKDNITINLKNNESANISLFNILGQEVISTISNDNQTTIDVSDLNRGLYIVKVKQKGQTFTSKVSIF